MTHPSIHSVDALRTGESTADSQPPEGLPEVLARRLAARAGEVEIFTEKDPCDEWVRDNYRHDARAALAALNEEGWTLLPPGGEVSTQYTVIATDKDGRPMPGLLVHRALEAALRWKARLESDRTVRGFSLVIHQRSAYEWSGGPIREAYGPWSPVVSDNSTEEQA